MPAPRASNVRALRCPALALALAALGCAGAPAPPPPAPSVPRPPALPRLDAGPWVEIVSRRFEIRIPLPDGAAWRIDDAAGSWLSATHAASSSSLLVRLWREDDPMSRTKCEERARAGGKLPAIDPADVVNRRPIAVPPDFDTVVETAVRKAPAGPSIEALAVAVGGLGRRCFAYVFRTSVVDSAAGERAAGVRLAMMVEQSLSGLVLENALSPRLEREPR
jgi:hypothetical protein